MVVFWIPDIFILEMTCFRKKDRPPCANPAPVGSGGAYDASGFLGSSKYGTIANGAPQRRGEALERHGIPNDFNRADIFAHNRLMGRIPPEKGCT